MSTPVEWLLIVAMTVSGADNVLPLARYGTEADCYKAAAIAEAYKPWTVHPSDSALPFIAPYRLHAVCVPVMK